MVARSCPRVLFSVWATFSQTRISFSQIKEMDSQKTSPAQLQGAKRAGFWGLFVGDALAMPVHWYYNTDDIPRGYGGWIRGYTAPNQKHPTSILSLSATGGSGRSGGRAVPKPVIGHVILHDKLQYWTSNNKKTHYHRGMSSGDNTLNAVTALHILRTLQRVDPDRSLDIEAALAAVMEDYVKFMTTPGSHADTYAESFHRLFFKNWVDMEPSPTSGPDIVQAFTERFNAVRPDREDGQLASIGSLVIAIPWILHYADLPKEECVCRVTRALQLTHPAPSLAGYIELYAQLLYDVLHGADLKAKVQTTLESPLLGGPSTRKKIEGMWRQLAEEKDSDGKLELAQDAVATIGMACYIKGALTSMLYLAGAFQEDYDAGILTNTNCGGENVHRGAALSTVLAVHTFNRGKPVGDKWTTGLNSLRQEILKTIEHDL